MKKLNQNGFSVFEITLLILVLAALSFAGYTVWQKSNDTSTQGPTQANQEQESLDGAKTTEKDALSSDERVVAAIKAYCNANVDPETKQPLVLKVGTAGPSQKQVLYSSDKNFAYVNAVCSKDGTTEGSGAAYYLKKVNNVWVFLYRGQMVSEDYMKQFNIPSEFN